MLVGKYCLTIVVLKIFIRCLIIGAITTITSGVATALIWGSLLELLPFTLIGAAFSSISVVVYTTIDSLMSKRWIAVAAYILSSLPVYIWLVSVIASGPYTDGSDEVAKLTLMAYTTAYILGYLATMLLNRTKGWLGGRISFHCLQDKPKCLHCGYDLQGLTERRCPECGKHFSQ